MKITKRQLRRIIREEKEQLLREYELHVDADGNVYDDEGNVERRGATFGRKYGGETYLGTSPPWHRRTGPAPTQGSALDKQKKAIEKFLTSKPNNFLQSILSQINAGKRLSSKQTDIMKKILVKSDPTAADLFESVNLAKKETASLQEQRDPSPGYDHDPYSDPAQQGQSEVEHMQYEEYKAWVKEVGHVTPAASSVMATYFVEQGLENDHELHELIAGGFGVDHEDVMRDIRRQQSERSVTMGEGTDLGNMPDSWRQILGDCLGDDE